MIDKVPPVVYHLFDAAMAKLANAADLKSASFGITGSIPVGGTTGTPAFAGVFVFGSIKCYHFSNKQISESL